MASYELWDGMITVALVGRSLLKMISDSLLKTDTANVAAHGGDAVYQV